MSTANPTPLNQPRPPPTNLSSVAPPPKKPRRGTLVPKLDVHQLISKAAVDSIISIGCLTAARPANNAPDQLSAILRRAARWAATVAPDHSLASFVHSANVMSGNRALRSHLVHVRLAAERGVHADDADPDADLGNNNTISNIDNVAADADDTPIQLESRIKPVSGPSDGPIVANVPPENAVAADVPPDDDIVPQPDFDDYDDDLLDMLQDPSPSEPMTSAKPTNSATDMQKTTGTSSVNIEDKDKKVITDTPEQMSTSPRPSHRNGSSTVAEKLAPTFYADDAPKAERSPTKAKGSALDPDIVARIERNRQAALLRQKERLARATLPVKQSSSQAGNTAKSVENVSNQATESVKPVEQSPSSIAEPAKPANQTCSQDAEPAEPGLIDLDYDTSDDDGSAMKTLSAKNDDASAAPSAPPANIADQQSGPPAEVVKPVNQACSQGAEPAESGLIDLDCDTSDDDGSATKTLSARNDDASGLSSVQPTSKVKGNTSIDEPVNGSSNSAAESAEPELLDLDC